MGITTSLRKLTDLEIKEMNSFLEENIPSRDLFFSNLGEKPFDTKYPIIVSRASDTCSASYIGILSEIYIDVVAGRYIETEFDIYEELSMMVLCELSGKVRPLTVFRDSEKCLLENLSLIKDYMANGKIAEADVVQALHVIYKHGLTPFDSLPRAGEEIVLYEKRCEEVYKHIFEEPLSESAVDEIIKIGQLFLKQFTMAGILKKNSEVVVNPRFGDWSETLGAEGDLWIDGVIYDIKSRSKEGYKKDEIEQVYGYYMCSVLEDNYAVSFQGRQVTKKPANMLGKKVTGIGLYMSRFGEIITCDIEKIGCVLNPDELNNIACIIAKSKQDRREKYRLETEEITGQRLDPLIYGVYRRQRFVDMPLSYNDFKCSTLYEYMSYAYPPRVISKVDISDKRPVMWKGKFPVEVNENDYYFVVTFKARFYLKRGEEPFVRAHRDFMHDKSDNMVTSDFYDKKDGKYYTHYRDSKGNVIPCRPVMTMTKEDFTLFFEKYYVLDIEYIDGCYFK